MPFVSSAGAKLYYEAHGAGPAIVFAHGLSGHTLLYYQQVPFFARSYRVVVFDHRGFGRSACPLEKVSPEYFVEDLASILDAESIERAALVCQSMGGLTGLPFALRYPNRVSVLVLAIVAGRNSHRASESGVRRLDPEAREAWFHSFRSVVRRASPRPLLSGKAASSPLPSGGNDGHRAPLAAGRGYGRTAARLCDAHASPCRDG